MAPARSLVAKRQITDIAAFVKFTFMNSLNTLPCVKRSGVAWVASPRGEARIAHPNP